MQPRTDLYHRGALLISKDAVSEIADPLWEEHEAFCPRDRSAIEVKYLFADATQESLRRVGAKEGVLAARCITSEGRKILRPADLRVRVWWAPCGVR